MGLESGIQPVDMVIRSIDPIASRTEQDTANNIEDKGFGHLLANQLDSVIDLQNNAEQMQRSFLEGSDVSLGDVVLAVQKADLALTFAVEFRNKVVDAYQEISRIQL